MGYYTNYRITVKANVENAVNEEIEAFLALLRSFNFLQQEKQEGKAGGFIAITEESKKWYDCFDEIKGLSKSYPNVLFDIQGEGESDGDLWKCYIINGKKQYVEAIINYPEFNPDLLE